MTELTIAFETSLLRELFGFTETQASQLVYLRELVNHGEIQGDGHDEPRIPWAQ